MQADSYQLERFIKAQQSVYPEVVNELKQGKKTSHWMWYIFPQITGLGQSPIAKEFAIKSLEEARAYLDHPVLGARLKICAQLVLDITDRSANDIFGYPDDLKLKSSMTLFASIESAGNVFEKVLIKYFDGKADEKTLDILEFLSHKE